MNRTASRLLATATAIVLGAGALGCGVLGKVKQAVDNVSAISKLSDRLGKSGELTFTAEYKNIDGSKDDGKTTTVVQQPPKAAYLGTEGRFILTDDTLYNCAGKPGAKLVCHKSPVQTGQLSKSDQATYLSAVAGGGFVNAEMALALMTAAAVVPGVKIVESTATIAGQKSDCLDVTGIPRDADPNAVTAKEFHVCVSENGLLTRFKGVGTDDKPLGVELTKYSDKVDPQAFVPPKGAQIIEGTAPPVPSK
ncbi:hypothetical protein [Dactylosporangium sp. NPDC048998]|uniref:hypothetical protein n=1 Tax=Dactylosporangium sp. NPDC048998 TaxID=3363976 RepID=UPI0037182634